MRKPRSTKHHERGASRRDMFEQGIAYSMKSFFRLVFPAFIFLSIATMNAAWGQDWIHTGSNLGNARIRLAAADFKAASVDPDTPALKATFDSTLYSDLQNAGIFDMVSKAMAPQATPGSPQEISLAQWAAAPANSEMVAF